MFCVCVFAAQSVLGEGGNGGIGATPLAGAGDAREDEPLLYGGTRDAAVQRSNSMHQVCAGRGVRVGWAQYGGVNAVGAACFAQRAGRPVVSTAVPACSHHSRAWHDAACEQMPVVSSMSYRSVALTLSHLLTLCAQMPVVSSMSYRWLEDAVTEWQTSTGQVVQTGGLAGYTPKQVSDGRRSRLAEGGDAHQSPCTHREGCLCERQRFGTIASSCLIAPAARQQAEFRPAEAAGWPSRAS